MLYSKQFIFGAVITFALASSCAAPKQSGVIIAPKPQPQQPQPLKDRFKFTYDEFKKTGKYEHTRWEGISFASRSLKCVVISTGDAYAVSSYSGSSWLFHTKVAALIDGDVYETEEQSTLAGTVVRDISGKYVSETVYYPNSESFIGKIAENKDKVIKIRLYGSKAYKEEVLADKDKQAFFDCWELAKMLKQKPDGN